MQEEEGVVDQLLVVRALTMKMVLPMVGRWSHLVEVGEEDRRCVNRWIVVFYCILVEGRR